MAHLLLIYNFQISYIHTGFKITKPKSHIRSRGFHYSLFFNFRRFCFFSLTFIIYVLLICGCRCPHLSDMIFNEASNFPKHIKEDVKEKSLQLSMSLHQSVNTFEDSEEVPAGNHAWAACNSLQTCVLGMLTIRKYLFYFILP